MPDGVEGGRGGGGEGEPRRKEDRVRDGCAPGDRSNDRSAQQPWTDHVEEDKEMKLNDKK